MSNAENQQIAQTILAQMGGARRLAVMTGAKNFVAIERGVQFSIGRNEKGVNKVIIRLNSADLYDIEFGAVRGMNWRVIEKVDGAYCDMLRQVFESATGMYLTL